MLSAAIAVILAGGLVAYYGYASNQISLLESAGQTVCNQLDGIYNPMSALIANGTSTLQQQIQSDNAIIQSLNSTQPSGYAEMIATLTAEASQDAHMLTLVNDLATATTSLSPLGPLSHPCTVLTGH